MDLESDEELEPRVKYSFIVQEEDYETEEESGTDSDPDSDSDSADERPFLEASRKSADERLTVQPWDPNDIFFRIK